MSRFQNSLYLGDVEERVRILEDVGQFSLAYALSSVHKLENNLKRLEQRIVDSEQETTPTLQPAELFIPPSPILCKGLNWPEIAITKDVFSFAVSEKGKSDEGIREVEGEIWDDENYDPVTPVKSESEIDADYMDDENAGGGEWADESDDDLFGDDDLDLIEGDGVASDQRGAGLNDLYIAPNDVVLLSPIG